MVYQARLRPAVSADADALASLMRRSVRGLSEGFYSLAQSEAAERFITTPDADIVSDGTFYVVEWEGEIVACGGWSSRKKLFTGSSDQEGLSAERIPPPGPARIRAFFIDPGWSRRGLGTQIYGACEEAASQAGYRSFELVATLPGVPFYTRLGFHEIEPAPIDLPDGSVLPAVRMGRPIG